MTKSEIIAKLQKMSYEYLGHNGWNFYPAYIRLTKVELETRYQRMQECLKFHRQAEEYIAGFDKGEVEIGRVFPAKVSENVRIAIQVHNGLTRQAMNLWHKV